MQQQYYITVDWNLNIRNASVDADGLITLCELISGALPTNPNRFQRNCILNSLGVGLFYNAGTVASPSFIPLGSGSGTPSLPLNSVQYNNAGAFGGDANFTRDPSTFATSVLMPQNAGVDIAGLVVDNDLFGVPGTNGVVLRRNDQAGTVGSTMIGIIDGTPVGAPSAYIGIFRADDAVTGEFFQQFFFAGTGGMSAGDGTNSGVFQIGTGDVGIGADNNDGGGNDSVSIQAELNGGAGAQTLRGRYQDGIKQYGFELSTNGITFDFDNFNGTPGTFYTFPTADGSNGEVLTTDGAGNISFAAIPPASAALTATYIGFGDGSNLLSGDADFTYGSTYSYVAQTTPTNDDSLTYGAAVFTGSGLNDLTLTWNSSVYNSQKYGGSLTITIDTTGTPDTFNWTFTGGFSEVIGSGTGVMMVPGVQVLNDIYGNVIAHVQFGATTGHTATDRWNASTSLGGNTKGYNMVDTVNHRFFVANPNGGTYLLGDDGALGGTNWWGNGTKLLIGDGNGELGLFAPRYLRFEHPTPGTYTAALVDMQAQIWANYGDFRVLDSATSSVWFRVNTASRNINIGDVQSAGNDTLFTIDDNTATMTGTLDGIFTLQAVLGSDFFTLNTTTGNVRFGDISGALNSTNFFIDDQNSEIKGFLDGEFFIADSLSNRMLSVDTTTITAIIGDVDGLNNSTYSKVDDTNKTIEDYVQGVNRRVVAPEKVLTNNSANSIFEIALPSGAMTGGTITATIIATDGTELQSHSDVVTYAAVNKAGVYTTQITTDPTHDANAASAGTIAPAWTITTGANKITVQVDPASSLTTTDVRIYFQVDNNDGNVLTVL